MDSVQDEISNLWDKWESGANNKNDQIFRDYVIEKLGNDFDIPKIEKGLNEWIKSNVK